MVHTSFPIAARETLALRTAQTRWGRVRAKDGFSLIEILTVVTIAGLLLAVTVPALRALSGADSLSTQTAIMCDLLTEARSDAISLRTPVQLRIVTDSWQTGSGNDLNSCYRKVSLWKLQQTDPNNPDLQNTQWLQLSPWQSLGLSVAFETAPDPTSPATTYGFTSANTPSGYTYFLNNSYLTTTLTTGTPLLTSQIAVNSTTADMVAIEFSPTGSLNTGSSPLNLYMLLTEGHYNGTALTYTEKKSPVPDWAQVRILNLTGEISVVRP